MKKFLFVGLLGFFFSSSLLAQSVAINASGATANASSILDVQSTTKGMLIPRMTKVQKNAIATPAIGLLIYQGAPDSTGFYYYSGSIWVWLKPALPTSDDWNITGNPGTDTAINFIGTTDNMPLAFRVNNEKSGRIESNAATANTFLGFRAGRFNTGVRNTAFGNRAMADTITGNENTAIGAFALNANKTGFFNMAMGSNSLAANTTGYTNTAIGTFAMQNNTTGFDNTAIGAGALTNNTTAFGNVAFGTNALSQNTIGTFNVAIGSAALPVNLTGTNNIALGGFLNMGKNTSGSSNISIASYISNLGENTTGSGNIAIANSLINNKTGNNNIGIGFGTLYSTVNKNNLIAIGTSALYSNGLNASSALQAIENIAIGNEALYSNKRGSNNVAFGNNTAAADTNQFHNVAIGNSAMQFSNGDRNTAVGTSSLLNNTGNSNVAIGDSAMIETSQSFNTAIGAGALKNNTGRSNTAVGYRSLQKNATGNNNVAIGDSAAYNSNVSDIVAVGSKALFSNTIGIGNTAVGVSSLQSNTTGFGNTAIGNSALPLNTGSANTALGNVALLFNTTGGGNTALGYASLFSNTTGIGNAAIGGVSLYHNTTGDYNYAMGENSLRYRNGSNNIAIGKDAGAKSTSPLTSFSNNIFIGTSSGLESTGDNNLFLGNNAGTSTMGNSNIYIGTNVGTGFGALSNTLAIDNSSTTTPLILGNFTTNQLRINGTLDINNQYSFPTTDGTANQVLRTNGAGAVGWATVNGENTTASNGLTLTASNVALGGTLLNNTTLTHSNFNITHSLSGTGDFLITTPSNNPLSVLSTGNVGINTNAPTHRLHLINDVSGTSTNYANGMFIQNTNATAGQATLAFKNTVLPSNRAWITGMNTFDNYVIAYGDSLSATNVVVRVDTAGFVGINPLGFPGSRLDVNGSFGNAIRVVSTNQTLSEDDHTIIVATGTGAITITLPLASSCERREYIIVNRTGTDKTISPAYNDFSGTATNAPANASITLQSNGTSWFRIQ